VDKGAMDWDMVPICQSIWRRP